MENSLLVSCSAWVSGEVSLRDAASQNARVLAQNEFFLCCMESMASQRLRVAGIY